MYGEVMPLYIAEPSIWAENDLSARHFQFVCESLADLQSSIEYRGGTLFTFIGEMEEVLESLLKAYGTFTLYTHEERGTKLTYDRNIKVSEWMRDRDLKFFEYPIDKKSSGGKLQARWSEFAQGDSIAVPKRFQVPEQIPDGFYMGAKKLKSFHVKGTPIRFGQQGGEQQAIETLETFLNERFHNYEESGANLLQSTISSSRLSPYLAWGNISLQKIVQKTSIKIENCDNLFLVKQLEAFQSRLKERWKLLQQSDEDIKEIDFLNEFSKDETYKKWLNGDTGIPMIDASMKCLQKTGWIPFKFRAMLASFAFNTLLIDQQMCRDALASLFLDYEPVIHNKQIQTITHKLHDPITIGKKEDPEGIFIRRYVPSLTNVPHQYIHEPWHFPGFFHLDYPAPIVDVKKVNQHARMARSGAKKRNGKPSENEQLSFDLF
jgi:deoxyribodipyrimidine photo-lyase